MIKIFGDSWSYRSFRKLPDFKEEFGTLTFQQLFKQNNILAINYSQQGSSNSKIIASIENAKLQNDDVAVVFQTDPLRDCVDRKSFKPTGDLPIGLTLNQLAEQSLNTFYQKLSDVPCPVLLVGGLSRLAHDLIPNNIYHIQHSWTELANPGFQDCYFEWVEFAELVHGVVKCTDDLTTTKQQIQAKNYVWQNSDCFSWCHPSDLGYNIMFAELQKTLLDKGLI